MVKDILTLQGHKEYIQYPKRRWKRMSSYNFVLRATGEAAEILKSIEKGKKTDYVSKAILAYHHNQLGGNKEYKTSHLEVLSTISDRLGEISQSLGDVTLAEGNAEQKPKGRPEEKESGNSLDHEIFILKKVEI